MKHILYKTTNLLNDRFYIGMHSTENLDDGYLGSGKRLKAEIKKYGKENFKREVLEILPSRDALEKCEAEVVTEELRANPLCLNLKNGGEGGGKFWNEEHQRKCASAGGQIGGKIAGPIVGRLHSAKQKRLATNMQRYGVGNKPTFGTLGKKYSQESRIQMSESGSGKNNSQFGTCWVAKDSKPMKIKKEQLDEYLANGYSRGRK